MNRRITVQTLIAIMLIVMLAFSGCGAQNAESGDSHKDSVEYVIRIGLSDAEDNLLAVSLQNYADWVSEETDGRVFIRLYLGLPFLFSSYEQAWAVMDDEEIAAGLTQGLEDYNMIQLAFWENGMRQITNSAREISSPEDVAGLRMRIPDDAMTASIFRELGAETTKFAWSKTYDALAQGTFDGQENPVANIYSGKINEVNKYMTLTNHKYESKNLVFSLSTWKKLPEDIQEILAEGAVTFGQEHREAVASHEESQIEELKKSGMIINENPDLEAFKAATRSVYTDFELQNEWTADLVAKIRAAASANN